MYSLIYNVRHIQLLQRDKCFIVLEDQNGIFSVYLETLSTLDNAIQCKRVKKSLHREKLGDEVFLAMDEQKRAVAVCGINNAKVGFQSCDMALA